MDGNFLIPANSKKSKMILGLFTTFDAILFASGIGITIFLMLIIHTNNFISAIMILMPALIVTFLVFPIPNYHNVLQLLINIYTFYFVRQMNYKWKGWCYKNGSNK